MRSFNRDEKGAASFIVVIFLAIILSVVTIGFVRLAVNERRASTDDDLTKRAFYAAESGTEDAKRAIQQYLESPPGTINLNEGDDNCDHATDGNIANYNPVVNDNVGFDVEYTCQLIDITPSEFVGDLDTNESIVVPINPVNAAGNPVALSSLQINWHINDSVTNDGDGLISAGDVDLSSSDGTLHDLSGWSALSYPAMLRVNIFGHSSGIISPGTLDNPGAQNVSFLYPNSGAGSGPIDISAGPGGEVHRADCDSSASQGDFLCTQRVDGFGGAVGTYYLRLTSLYRGANFSVTLNPSGGTPTFFKDAQAVIDVTGRASDVFRRVRTTILLDNFRDVPSSAITSLDAICKDFSITNRPADFDGVSGTSCQ